MAALEVSVDSVRVDGADRRYLLAEPRQPASAIVLSLHGSRSTPEGQARLSRMATLTGTGAVVVFPQGSIGVGSGFEWEHDRDAAMLDSLGRRPRPAVPGRR